MTSIALSPARTTATRTPATARTIVTTTATAVAVNLAVFAVGKAAGTSFADHEGALNAAAIAMVTAVPFLLGLTITALVARRRPGFVRVAKVVGPTLSVLTVGLTLAATFDTASTAFLAAMHLALIPVLVRGLDRLGR